MELSGGAWLAIAGVVVVALIVLAFLVPEVFDVIGDIIDAAGMVIGLLLFLLCCGGCLWLGVWLGNGPG